MWTPGSHRVAPLPGMPPENMAGPFPWCNWVIGRQVLAGAFPATLDDEETNEILTVFLELGISTFVCLQAEFRLDQPESSWRNSIGLRPYIKDATTLMGTAAAQKNPRIKQKKLDFLHLAIIDGSVTTDAAMQRLEEDVRHRILIGEGIYIHCWGGHGRTGTLVALLLSSLYGLGAQKALAYTQALHDCRENPQGVRSPQTRIQRDQVRRIISHRAQQTLFSSLRATSFGATNDEKPSQGKPAPTMQLTAKKGSVSWQQQRGTDGRLSSGLDGGGTTTSGSQPYRPIAKQKQTPATYRSLSPAKRTQEGHPTAALPWPHPKMRQESSSAAQQNHHLEHPSDAGRDVLIRAGRFESNEGLEAGGRFADSEAGERHSRPATAPQGKKSTLPHDRSLPALLQSNQRLSGEHSDISEWRPKTTKAPRMESGRSFASGTAALLRASTHASVDRAHFAHMPSPQRPGPSREASEIPPSNSLTPALRAASRPSRAANARGLVASLIPGATSSSEVVMRPWVPAAGSSPVPQVLRASQVDVTLPASMARDWQAGTPTRCASRINSVDHTLSLRSQRPAETEKNRNKGGPIGRQPSRSGSARPTPRQSAELAVVNLNLQQSCGTGKRPASSRSTAPLSARVLQDGDHSWRPRSAFQAAEETLPGRLSVVGSRVDKP